MLRKIIKRVCICGHFAYGKELLNGQTIKTKIITAELERTLGEDEIMTIDTHGGGKKLLLLPFVLLNKLRICKNIIILPAQNGLRIIAPLLVCENILFRRKLHYVVIGGWLPDFLRNKPFLSGILKKFDYIYVETTTMKHALAVQGFRNVEVVPNCKELDILDESELVYAGEEPFKLCTFSRVMKEKGIEDAVEAVKLVNETSGRTVYTLDIYGQVDSNQVKWFEDIQLAFPDYVKYSGIVPFDKTSDTLKNYYMLLFPTYYNGEGFAGTLIDALAAGVPVIASDWKYNQEVVLDGVTGFIVPAHNIPALTKQLFIHISNPAETNALKIKCLQEAEKYLPGYALEPLYQKLRN